MTEETKRRTSAAEAADAAVDIAVGGVGILAGKAIDAADELAAETREAAREGVSSVRQKARTAARTARRKVDDSDTRRYEDRTRDELYDLAVERDIAGRSTMRKHELIEALRS